MYACTVSQQSKKHVVGPMVAAVLIPSGSPIVQQWEWYQRCLH